MQQGPLYDLTRQWTQVIQAVRRQMPANPAGRYVPSGLTDEKGVSGRRFGPFFVIGLSDINGKPNQFYSRVCCKDVPVLIYGHHEILRYF